MAWTRLKTVGVATAALLLATGIATIVMTSPAGLSGQGSLRLPVGKGTPAISLGQRHGLILASDGSLWSWGSDFLGWPVLGLGKVQPQTRLRHIGNETNWISISAGTSHNVAVKSDGTLWAWGENLHGQFGVGTAGRENPMANIPVPAAVGNDWKQAAAGGIHTLAIKKDGTLWAWGNNWAGSLGTGTTINSTVPVQVGLATNWIKVWAGTLESVGQQSDGSLWYWGDNPDPAFDMKTGQILVPTPISPDTNWVDVGFGPWTVFAIKADGTLWTWGRNAHVYSAAQDQTLDTIPTRVGMNSDWQSIPACGVWWCQGLTKKDGPIGVALTRDGEVWTWGLMLGDPPTLGRRLLYSAIKLMDPLGAQEHLPAADAVVRQTPWRLPHVEPDVPPKR